MSARDAPDPTQAEAHQDRSRFNTVITDNAQGWPSPLPGETDHRLDRGEGTVLHYRLRRADRSGARGQIVLLHGLASNLTRWSEFIEQTSLKTDWHLLRVDLRGHGESLTKSRLSMEGWCDDLAVILNASDCPRAVLVGHSLGAHVAAFFAARHPRHTRAIGLIDPLLREAARGNTRRLFAFAPLMRGLAGILRGLNALGIRRRDIPPRDLRALDERTRALITELGDASAIVTRYISPRADLRHIRAAHYFQDLVELLRPLPLAQVQAPVLGLLSRGLTFSDLTLTRQALTALSASVVVELDAYHWPLTERPVEVRRAIEEWCGALPG